MTNISKYKSKINLKKLSKQRKIIAECLHSGQSLADVLMSFDWGYDDLQYEAGEEIDIDGCEYLTLDDFKSKKTSIPVVSFFSGAGGLDLGFEAAGFDHVALVEKNSLFCDTLRTNRPEWHVLGPPGFEGDVSRTEILQSQLSSKIGKATKGYEGVFIGGPPCQPFSIASNQRFSKSGNNFKRTGFAHELNGNLLFEFIEQIRIFRPSAFLIENVPGLLDIDNGEQLQQAYKILESAGYTVHQPTILLASQLCVPQNRKRLFIVGNRLGAVFRPPTPSLKSLSCAGAFNKDFKGLLNHVARDHALESIIRYIKLEYGHRDQLGRVDRLDPRLPSKTIIAGGTAGGGRSHLHPFIPRTITVRECAVLQTFPDDFIFEGPVARQFTQVGNAVPPVLGAQLARSMLESFF